MRSRITEVFNEQIKNDYIEYYCKRHPKGEKNRNTYFNDICSLKDFEYDLKKDIYDFTKEEWCKTLISLNAPSTLSTRISRLNGYLKWAYEHKFSSEFIDLNKLSDHEKISDAIIEKQLKYAFDRNELYELCEKCSADDHKLYLILLFERLSTTEIVKLKIKDCIINENILVINNRKIRIPERSMKYLESYISKHHSKSPASHYVFGSKGRKNTGNINPLKPGSVGKEIPIMASKLNKNLDVFNIRLYGILDYVRLLEYRSDLYSEDNMRKIFLRFKSLMQNKYNFKNFRAMLYPEFKEMYKISNYNYSFNENEIDELMNSLINVEVDIYKPGKKSFIDNENSDDISHFDFGKRKKGENPYENDIGRNFIKRGEEGEKKLAEILKAKNKSCKVIKVAESECYDLDLAINNRLKEKIEVKTISPGESYKIYMTMEEIKCATKLKDVYYLYLIVWPSGEKEPDSILKLKNPIHELNIDVDLLELEINKVKNNKLVNIYCRNYCIELTKEIINKFEKIKF